jgi:hypothetical protein
MRYWAYLAGKVVVAAVPLYGLLFLLERSFPPLPKNHDPLAALAQAGKSLACDLWLLGWFVLCVATVYMIVWDQRRRCRVCLRQLRMPIETGSRSYMLQLGRPTVESICPYGHGTLKEDELQITGHDSPEWKRNSDDIWDELCAPYKDTSQEP